MPEGTMIPFVTRGPLDNPKTEIEPEFWAAVIAAYAGKELEKRLGDLFDDVFDR